MTRRRALSRLGLRSNLGTLRLAYRISGRTFDILLALRITERISASGPAA